MNSLALIGLLAVAASAAHVVNRYVSRRARRDRALNIVPPRQYVDADGRSDFRPELREAAEIRRFYSRPAVLLAAELELRAGGEQ